MGDFKRRKRSILQGNRKVQRYVPTEPISKEPSEPVADAHEGDTEGISWWEEGRANWQNYLDKTR